MRVLDILYNENWIRDYDFYQGFMDSKYINILEDTYENLNTDILFKSHIHGKDHIERVIFFASLIAYFYDLDDRDSQILMDAASLHDTRRVNDGWDTEHGRRAAIDSIQYSTVCEEDKKILQAVMSAHSTDDKNMDQTIIEFIGNNGDFDRCKKLCKYFKDSDGLDRVRTNHLDPNYLRNEKSKDLVDLAYRLYEKY